jgi:RHH-type proline utilization regulon transcriptional repressor/proline dehydrogenase/delta 1-pyrroline-5-carboxylate dehydrogenase
MLNDVEQGAESLLRERLRKAYLADEAACVHELIELADLSAELRQSIAERARRLVEQIRGGKRSHAMMESFLNEYGLTNEEGIALMCLAEAMLRVPDTFTMDALIQDKIGPADWERHLGHSESIFVNASSWGLMLAGTIVREDESVLRGRIRSVVRKLGEPVIRLSISKAMELLGEEFVLGRTIEEAMERAVTLEDRGYTYSYDMLGEAALTAADAKKYFLAYSQGISSIAKRCAHSEVAANPGISLKLSALHPRYEFAKRERVMSELVPRVLSLAMIAKNANMGLTIDAEEADRLDLSLDVIEAVSANDDLKGWGGLGVVVQSYLKRAPRAIDYLADMAERHHRRFMVRLVKGAYWDAEIKRHQELGLEGYPVFTRKYSSDIAYLTCARMLLARPEIFYPQFATHNAHTAAAMLELAGENRDYEFQRLHGMGEALHERIVVDEKIPSRIYAPVGIHKDLLAYLVRRLLENGSNSSFVNQIVDETVPVEALIADPIEQVLHKASIPHDKIPLPAAIYGPGRTNSRGLNLNDALTVGRLKSELAPFAKKTWSAGPLVDGEPRGGEAVEVRNPADRSQVVGSLVEAREEHASEAVTVAGDAFSSWSTRSARERGQLLRRVAELYEQHTPELIALCVREAGKTYPDAVSEIREAVDFLRYYGAEAERLEAETHREPLGVFACISPWNFPLAIFSGQIAGALAAGNAVLAKPAEQTPLIAHFATKLFHEAGIPGPVLQLLPGRGETVGAALVANPGIAGVCFTGSTAVARLIRQTMVEAGNDSAVLVAETGGLNAMMVDSTALPEQAVKDVLASAFQSAGQRCSALRLLFIQQDVADSMIEMLCGAMAELAVGDPSLLSTDVGPVIDEEACLAIRAHVDKLRGEAALIAEAELPPGHEKGTFVAPAAFELRESAQLEEEIFGPVLHIVRYNAERLEEVVESINHMGYGLTMGLHTRIGSTADRVSNLARIGNIYINRNQIGAVVGVQPFGGEGLSGTGPKAGGPNYLLAFTGYRREATTTEEPAVARPAAASPGDTIIPGLSARARVLQTIWDSRTDRGQVLARVADAFDAWGTSDEVVSAVEDAAEWATLFCADPLSLPGPTGEQNQIACHGRGVFLCLGDGAGSDDTVVRQAAWALAAGNGIVATLAEEHKQIFVSSGVPAMLIQTLPRDYSPLLVEPADLQSVDGVALEATGAALHGLSKIAAARPGPILPVICGSDRYHAFATERTVTINTTAAGGNASLLAMTD